MQKVDANICVIWWSCLGLESLFKLYIIKLLLHIQVSNIIHTIMQFVYTSLKLVDSCNLEIKF